MKVALFSRYPQDSDAPLGGIEAVTVVLVRALSALQDLDVHVVTLERSRSFPQLSRDGPVTIHRLPGSRWPLMVDVLVGPGRRRLLCYLMRLNPDVVHAHETHGLGLWSLPIPHVFTVHGFDDANLIADSARLAWLRSPLWRAVQRYGLGRQQRVISITPYVRRTIEQMTPAAIHDIDNPVDERFFSISRCEEPGRILCVGWINDRKNTLGSVEAFAQVIKKGVEATLVIAGSHKEQDYYDRVMGCVKQYNLGNRIKVLGQIGREQLEQELARASVLLLPSRQENAPMAIAEAMAAGVPVVTSDRCGMPYMVREGESGFLVDPEDHDAIADRLVRLCSDRAMRERFGRAGREIAMMRFQPLAVAERTREVYRTACGWPSLPVPTGPYETALAR